MDLLHRQQRILIIILSLLSLAGLTVVIWIGLRNGDVLSENSTVTVTGSVPHIISIQTLPGARIPPVGNNQISESIELRAPGSTTVLYTITATTDNNGNVTLPAIDPGLIPPGQYDVAVKGSSHLRRVFTNQVFDGPMVRQYTLTTPVLLVGDTNTPADNYVNSLDISYLAAQLYTNDSRADLTQDSIVNSLDLSALLNNLYVQGDD